MTSPCELQYTPNQLHGVMDEEFHEDNASKDSKELFKLFFHAIRACPCSLSE
jgi:hypothetical protein